MANWALVIGFFVVPTLLLALGHRLRERSNVQRGAFWGGVIGHTAAVLIAVLALHWPPVVWTQQDELRVFLAFWLMLCGGVFGAGVGAARKVLR